MPTEPSIKDMFESLVEASATKSRLKADTAASGATQGALVGGTVPAAVLTLLRILAPGVLPWGIEADALLIGAIGILGSRVGAWVRVWRKDRKRHSIPMGPGVSAKLSWLVIPGSSKKA